MPLTFDDLNRLIQQGENATTEFKAEPSPQVLRGLSTDIAAMANYQGGMIVFGVTDDRDPRGCTLDAGIRDRITTEAKLCRPAIAVDFEEVPFGARRFLILKVPRSSVFHNDKEFRFPTRIGNQTDYLDALGLVAVFNERTPVQGEALQQFVQPVVEKQELSNTEAASVAHALSSPEPSVRLEGLRDVAFLASRFVLLDRRPIAEAVKRTLDSGTEQERDLVMQALRNRTVWKVEAETRIIATWVPELIELAQSAPPGTATAAFQILMNLRRKEAAEVLVQWVLQADDDRYTKLQPINFLQSTRYFGLYDLFREALYGLLEKPAARGAEERITNRVPPLLGMLRSSFS
ncbi:MAG TPA: ATP-binding protein [Thermoplasmata archaeon]|nr:ATP-binding protein [Thermoplasmata archaeon]